MNVYLVTDNDDTDELARVLLDGHPDPAVAGASVQRVSSLRSARRKLDAEPPPDLILLDGRVRSAATDPEPQDEAPAAAFLSELRVRPAPRPPVLVLSSGSSNKLILEVLQRWDVAIFTLGGAGTASTDFATVLASLTGTVPFVKRRRIHVTVGWDCARYSILDGGYTFGLERAYTVNYQPEMLINQSERFSPWRMGQPEAHWRTSIAEFGRLLYNLIFEDIFGHNLIRQMRADGGALEFRFHFDPKDDDKLERLFLLPFEAITEDYNQIDTFFCTSVPMARRIADMPSPADPSPSLRILLVIGAPDGVTSLRHETTGHEKVVSLQRLQSINLVRGYFERKAEPSGTNARFIEVEVLDRSRARGVEFVRLLKDRLKRSGADIVHFYGHSHTDDGGTFMIMPDDRPGMGLAVSVRSLAHWIGAAERKPRLVFLSSCQSGSPLAAIEMTRAGAANVLGFRWEVSEAAAAAYVGNFYDAYLTEGKTISESYRYACHEAFIDARGDPLWAGSVIAIAGSD